jgi:hypothetical protein
MQMHSTIFCTIGRYIASPNPSEQGLLYHDPFDGEEIMDTVALSFILPTPFSHCE